MIDQKILSPLQEKDCEYSSPSTCIHGILGNIRYTMSESRSNNSTRLLDQRPGTLRWNDLPDPTAAKPVNSRLPDPGLTRPVNSRLMVSIENQNGLCSILKQAMNHRYGSSPSCISSIIYISQIRSRSHTRKQPICERQRCVRVDPLLANTRQ